MRIFLLALFLVVAGPATAAKSIDRFIVDDGMTNAYRNPSAAVDSDGNIHIVAQGQANTLPANDDIYYFRISRNGAVRNGPILVSTVNHDNGRAHVAALPDGKAIVGWRQADKALKAAVIDPAAAAGVGAISVPEVTIMASANHFDMVVAGTSVHFLSNASSVVRHARFTAATLVSEVADHAVALASDWQDTKVTADDAGNLHMIARAGSDDAPYYAMLNNAGVPQIGITYLYDNGTGEGSRGNHFGIAMDDDLVEIVYADKRNNFDGTDCCYDGAAGTVFRVRIDPTNHTGGVGAAGDIEELRVGDELEVANTWYHQAFKGSDGNWHVVNGTGAHGTGDIVYHRVSGNSVSSAIASANNQGYHYYRKYVTGAGNMVVWTEGVFVPTLSGATNRLVAAKTSQFVGGGGGGGGAPGPLMLLMLGLAALVRARMRS
jgi:hypothetical protein